MIRRGALVLLAALACVGSASANVSRWVAVPGESSITMQVSSALGRRSGRFERWAADVRYDPAAPETAQVTIAVEAGSLRMGDATLTRAATGAGLLDATRYPDIRFQLRSLRRTGEGAFDATADVTMKGVTRPVTFPVTLHSDGRTAQMVGGFSVDRTAFGIGTQAPWNGLIGRQVRVNVSLATRSAG